jgi:glycine betaine/choline ABC-type transport system substrate-binding protein
MITRRRFLKLSAAGLAAAGAGGLLGGCKRDDGAEGEPGDPSGDLDLVIGSKNFQEQRILAALIATLLEREAGAAATTREFETTFACHEALTEGAIQSYVEYTGTAYAAVLRHYPQSDPDAVYAQVKKQYAEDYGVLWLPPLGFENKYAILVRKESADEHGLATISDLATVQSEFRPGFGFEFYDRGDGYSGLIETYELSFEREPAQMDMDAMYDALVSGDVDLIAGNSTDGNIAAHDLVMLEDDRTYFPPYYAAPLLRADTAEAEPKIREALASLGGRIDLDAMRRANHAVDTDGQSPEAAAAALLEEIGLS